MAAKAKALDLEKIEAIADAGYYRRTDLAVPEGLRLVHLPPYSSELQLTECLWELVDEPLARSSRVSKPGKIPY